MRLSDILKKRSAQSDSPSESLTADSQKDFSEHKKKEDSLPLQKRPPVFKKDEDRLSADEKKPFTPKEPSITERPVLPDSVVAESIARGEDLSEIYADAVKEARDVFSYVSASRKFQLPVSAGIIADLALEGRTDFLLFINRTTADHYIYSHVVNVSAIASLVAVKMGFDQEEVKKISAAAFLHDIGMAGMLDMVASKGRFGSKEEISRIRQHPLLGQNIAEEFLNISDEGFKKFISSTIAQIHERAMGQGYPKGLKLENIQEAAMIIAVADSYEAMTHTRSYREQLIPHEAVKTLINESEENYNPEVMKAFLTGFSLYPVGSYVRLTNNQVGRVLKVNENMPTRPVIRLVVDQNGKKVVGKNELDLEETSIVAIKEAVDETKIKIDPKLSLELQTQRWWIR